MFPIAISPVSFHHHFGTIWLDLPLAINNFSHIMLENSYAEFKMVATNTPLSFGGDQPLVIENIELFPNNFSSVNFKF